MGPAIFVVILLLGGAAIRGGTAAARWWDSRQRRPRTHTIRPARPAVPRREADCGRAFTHLLLRLFGSEDDCRYCGPRVSSEPLPFPRNDPVTEAADSEEANP